MAGRAATAALAVAAAALLGSTVPGCVNVPPEAPELADALGARLVDIETAHVDLVEDFFAERRARIDRHLDAVWVPAFAREFFEAPANAALWEDVAASDDPSDRVVFLTVVGPALQSRINAKRDELVGPLEAIEREVRSRLRGEYAATRRLSDVLETYLAAASDTTATRDRALEAVGVERARTVERLVDEAGDAVDVLLETALGVETGVEATARYRDTLAGLARRLTELDAGPDDPGAPDDPQTDPSKTDPNGAATR